MDFAPIPEKQIAQAVIDSERLNQEECAGGTRKIGSNPGTVFFVQAEVLPCVTSIKTHH